MDTTFISLNSKKISSIIDSSARELIFISPGISDEIATAIVHCKNNNSLYNSEIIVDDDPNAIRLGYGTYEALHTLELNDIPIRSHRGIRIGLIVADDASYIFNPTPQIIEEEPKDNLTPNAIHISEVEANAILESIIRNDSIDEKPNIEVGEKVITEVVFNFIKKDIETRPPIKPDLFRQMNVINSVFQLVETHLTGARVQAKTFTLTPQDLGIKNKEVANRIRASYKIIEHEDILELSELEGMHNNIKEQYFVSIPKYGKLIMYESVKDFNSAILELRKEIKFKQKTLVDVVNNKLKRSKELLIPLIADNLQALPVDELRKVVFPLKFDKSGILEFVTQKLERKFPKAEQILSDIELTVRITNVSSQLMEEDDFRKKVEKAFGKPFNEIIRIESVVEAKEY